MKTLTLVIGTRMLLMKRIYAGFSLCFVGGLTDFLTTKDTKEAQGARVLEHRLKEFWNYNWE